MNRKSPPASVVNVEVSLVAVLVRVTEAWATAAPAGSWTWPVIFPLNCAQAPLAATDNANTQTATRTTQFAIAHPFALSCAPAPKELIRIIEISGVALPDSFG